MNTSIPELPRQENKIQGNTIDDFAQSQGHAPAVVSESPGAANQEYLISRAFGIIGLATIGILSAAGIILSSTFGDSARQKAAQDIKVVRLGRSTPDSTILGSQYFGYLNTFSQRTGIPANTIAARVQEYNDLPVRWEMDGTKTVAVKKDSELRVFRISSYE